MTEGTTLVLAGDVMTGRGVDQILAAPGPPGLHEPYVVDARSYVELAERANGPIPAPVEPTWPFGEALRVMEDLGPAVRVMNLETGVTQSEDFARGKGIHYRMSPANVACLVSAGVDVWTMANNHVLDHGPGGLLETLEVLHRAGQRTAGAGADAAEAWSPTVVDGRNARVVVVSVAHVSSGVPPSWAAGAHHPGVALLPDLSEARADLVAEAAGRLSRQGDLRVVSLHWGGNWGYDVPREQRRFAHRLVAGGVDVVHGHSSHHPRPVEVHQGRLLLYGCGDLVNDYEGIAGYERYRDDLRLLYVAHLAGDGHLEALEMMPFRASRMRLQRAGGEDAMWLGRTLDEVSRPFGVTVRPAEGGTLEVRPGR